MRKGFTLMEVVIVVLIIGILASIAVPKYTKVVEESRAREAIARLQSVAAGNRVRYNETRSYATNQITGAAHPLVAGRYIGNEAWDALSYSYFACDPAAGNCCGSTGYACAKRKAGQYPDWGFVIDASGACRSLGGAPGCQ